MDPPGTSAAASPAFSSREIGRISAVLWSVGALLGAAGCLLPHGPHVAVLGWWLLSAMAGAVAVVTWRVATYLPLPLQYLQSVVACAAVSSALVCALHSPALYAVAALYVLTTVYAAAFYERAPLCCYLVCQTAASGALLLSSGMPGAPAAWVVLMGTATTAGVVVHLLVQALARTADADPLTGLPNRRAMERVVLRELSRAGRRGEQLCLALIDLDEFKQVNDRLGHAAGDRVLVATTSGWATRLRAGDVLGRFGGDEFVVVLPATTPSQAVAVLDRLRHEVDQPFSAGVAAAARGASFDDLLKRADAACYESKRSGTGVVVAPEPTVAGA